jgi:hypothetical protein
MEIESVKFAKDFSRKIHVGQWCDVLTETFKVQSISRNFWQDFIIKGDNNGRQIEVCVPKCIAVIEYKKIASQVRN